MAGAGDANVGAFAGPLLDVQRSDDTGLFARMAVTFDGLWAAADETVRSDEQLDAYLIDSPGIHEYVGTDPTTIRLETSRPSRIDPASPGPPARRVT